MERDQLVAKIFEVDDSTFDALALAVFHYQTVHNQVYAQYCSLVGCRPEKVGRVEEIPFLPVAFFKTHRVVSNDRPPQQVFSSSRTTGQQPSCHYVHDVALYQRSILGSFRQFVGDPASMVILALLPSYLEQPASSLVYMVDFLIKCSGHAASGFYRHNYKELYEQLKLLDRGKHPVLLLGVTFALLEFADRYPIHLSNTCIMETGGMKGRGREVSREELHYRLQKAFGVPAIASEYGMTELLSQAYARSHGLFACPPWMRVLVRDVSDPFFVHRSNGTGAINIIDLANVDSCSFIATDDRGTVFDNGQFVLHGRLEHSELRGCTLMWHDQEEEVG